jgi:hypothetical protein
MITKIRDFDWQTAFWKCISPDTTMPENQSAKQPKEYKEYQ